MSTAGEGTGPGNPGGLGEVSSGGRAGCGRESRGLGRMRRRAFVGAHRPRSGHTLSVRLPPAVRQTRPECGRSGFFGLPVAPDPSHPPASSGHVPSAPPARPLPAPEFATGRQRTWAVPFLSVTIATASRVAGVDKVFCARSELRASPSGRVETGTQVLRYRAPSSRLQLSPP